MTDDSRFMTFTRAAFPIFMKYSMVKDNYDFLDRLARIVARVPNSIVSSILGAILKSRSGQDHSSMTLAESLQVLKTCRAEAFDALNERYATKVLDTITSMRGYFIKLGQMGSLRSDYLPPQWIRELQKLNDNVPYADLSEVEEILCKDLGVASSAILFESIDPVPRGATVTEQVHHAVMRDGRVVAVKVLFPGIEQAIEWDMKILRDFFNASPGPSTFINEMEEKFKAEFDINAENANLQEVAKNMAKSVVGSADAVAHPLPELSGGNVVIMELMPGKKINGWFN
jgi:ubiquinone biosynthesis protein